VVFGINFAPCTNSNNRDATSRRITVSQAGSMAMNEQCKIEGLFPELNGHVCACTGSRYLRVSGWQMRRAIKTWTDLFSVFTVGGPAGVDKLAYGSCLLGYSNLSA
jgi:hypothetical protein